MQRSHALTTFAALAVVLPSVGTASSFFDYYTSFGDIVYGYTLTDTGQDPRPINFQPIRWTIAATELGPTSFSKEFSNLEVTERTFIRNKPGVLPLEQETVTTVTVTGTTLQRQVNILSLGIDSTTVDIQAAPRHFSVPEQGSQATLIKQGNDILTSETGHPVLRVSGTWTIDGLNESAAGYFDESLTLSELSWFTAVMLSDFPDALPLVGAPQLSTFTQRFRLFRGIIDGQWNDIVLFVDGRIGPDGTFSATANVAFIVPIPGAIVLFLSALSLLGPLRIRSLQRPPRIVPPTAS